MRAGHSAAMKCMCRKRGLQAHPINLAYARHDVVVEVLVVIISIVHGSPSLIVHCLIVHLRVLPCICLIIHLPVVILAPLTSIFSMTCNEFPDILLCL